MCIFDASMSVRRASCGPDKLYGYEQHNLGQGLPA